MSRPLRARLSARALATNFSVARGHAGSAQVMAVVKANGYGHGAEFVARTLHNADSFGVASIEEALTLREAGVRKPVYLLEGFFESREITVAARHGLIGVLHSESQIEMLTASDRPAQIWLKLDTGMHRLGFEATRCAGLRTELESSARAQVTGVMSHLARADESDPRATQVQINAFSQATESGRIRRSLANSAGLIAYPEARFDCVRPGIMLYGSSPFALRDAASLGLLPVMTLESELISVRACRKGDAVGYGGDFVCPEPMPVGVVACGYGDGYPRHAPPGTPVLVAGSRVPLIGRVSMDMISVDLRSTPKARVGSRVVLWGEGLPADEIAARAGTIAYELFCNVNPRVPRVTM